MDRNLMYPGIAIVMTGLLALNWGKVGGGVRADDARPVAKEIAVVDVNQVFESHKGAQHMIEQLKRDIGRAERDLNAMKDECQKLKTKLDAVSKGSDEFKRIEEELAEKFVAFEKLRAESKRKLREASAAMQLAAFREINEEVSNFAESRGHRLVLSFTPESFDQKLPQNLEPILNRLVHYQNGLDVTDEVIKSLN